MPRGGARPGAGRPRKHPRPEDVAVATAAAVAVGAGAAEKLAAQAQAQDPDAEVAAVPGGFADPKDFLRAVMNCTTVDIRVRQTAAVALMPFEHAKKGEGGKKEDAAKRAEDVAGGKFGARPAPGGGLKRVA